MLKRVCEIWIFALSKFSSHTIQNTPYNAINASQLHMVYLVQRLTDCVHLRQALPEAPQAFLLHPVVGQSVFHGGETCCTSLFLHMYLYTVYCILYTCIPVYSCMNTIFRGYSSGIYIYRLYEVIRIHTSMYLVYIVHTYITAKGAPLLYCYVRCTCTSL